MPSSSAHRLWWFPCLSHHLTDSHFAPPSSFSCHRSVYARRQRRNPSGRSWRLCLGHSTGCTSEQAGEMESVLDAIFFLLRSTRSCKRITQYSLCMRIIAHALPLSSLPSRVREGVGCRPQCALVRRPLASTCTGFRRGRGGSSDIYISIGA